MRIVLLSLQRSLLLLVALTVICGLAYPLAMTGIARVAFANRAAGSPLTVDGRIVGSSLIGQDFTGPSWFHSRPSAVGYNGEGSGGSNLGPTSKVLAATIAKRLASEGAGAPVDLVTASASGLDPDISVASARFQIARVARARGLPVSRVEALVGSHETSPTLGFMGSRRVNVLRLNLALSALSAGR